MQTPPNSEKPGFSCSYAVQGRRVSFSEAVDFSKRSPPTRSMRAGLSHSPHRCKDVNPQESYPQHTFLGSPPKSAVIHCLDFFLNRTVNFIHTDGHSGNQSRATGIRQYNIYIYILGHRIWSLYQRCLGNWAIPNPPLPAGIQKRGSSDLRR